MYVSLKIICDGFIVCRETIKMCLVMILMANR